MSAPTLERCTEALVESMAPESWKLLSDDSREFYREAARACIGGLLPVTADTVENIARQVISAENDGKPFLDRLSLGLTAALTAVLGEKA